MHGRGGTKFKPVFDRLEEMQGDVDGLIYFTDGGCWESESDIPRPKRTPVLWALTANDDVPFKWGGKTWVEVKKK